MNETRDTVSVPSQGRRRIYWLDSAHSSIEQRASETRPGLRDGTTQIPDSNSFLHLGTVLATCTSYEYCYYIALYVSLPCHDALTYMHELGITASYSMRQSTNHRQGIAWASRAITDTKRPGQSHIAAHSLAWSVNRVFKGLIGCCIRTRIGAASIHVPVVASSEPEQWNLLGFMLNTQVYIWRPLQVRVPSTC